MCFIGMSNDKNIIIIKVYTFMYLNFKFQRFIFKSILDHLIDDV